MLFSDLSKRYFKNWMNFAKFNAKSNLVPVHFNLPWWRTIALQKKYLVYIIITKTIETAFYTLVPTSLGLVLSYKNPYYFALFIACALLIGIIQYLGDYYGALLEMQSIFSIQYSAHQSFLTVDPLYHTTRSSGKIIGKIDRGVDAYEDIVDIVATDFLPTFVGLLTVTISFLQFDFFLGVLAAILIIITGIVNTALQILTNNAFEPEIIEAADQLNTVSIENLSQINFIRSTFASNEINKTLKNKNMSMLYISGTAWLAFSAVALITRIIYIFTLLILGLYLIYLINHNYVSTFLAVSLILTYISGSREILKVGRKIRKFLKSLTRVQDLFSFITIFGKQTFPVLNKPEALTDLATPKLGVIDKKAQHTISLKVHDITFDYGESIAIFDHHNFDLTINTNQANKLYGVIGPSGIGKTTFISIIGGQLKPQKGYVTIQGTDIYTLDDYKRRELIALQGQIASSLRGSLRYNLLFGLPERARYSDAILINLLEKVGLWSIFKAKEGLNTLIGESGLTISGGQRQRLNFANLYLRAQYYKPSVILIDEPTSSLDEISEHAITHMIDELAQDSLTLVIAHRLKTVENAQGIIDFSLIHTSNLIEIYTPSELLKTSAYYRQLIKGEVEFD